MYPSPRDLLRRAHPVEPEIIELATFDQCRDATRLVAPEDQQVPFVAALPFHEDIRCYRLGHDRRPAGFGGIRQGTLVHREAPGTSRAVAVSPGIVLEMQAGHVELGWR